jgi:hypothetical protein
MQPKETSSEHLNHYPDAGLMQLFRDSIASLVIWMHDYNLQQNRRRVRVLVGEVPTLPRHTVLYFACYSWRGRFLADYDSSS